MIESQHLLVQRLLYNPQCLRLCSKHTPPVSLNAPYRNHHPAAKLEAFLVSRAKTDIALLPAVRGALRDTTTTLRRARFGMGVASVAVGAARAGEYVQYVLARRAWEAGEEEARRREQVAALQALAERSRG